MDTAGEGYVYFFKLKLNNKTRGTNIYKIGFTRDLQQRFEGIQQGLPFELQIHTTFFCENYKNLEIHFHTIFAPKRIRGERYRLNGKDISRLGSIVDNFFKGKKERHKYNSFISAYIDE